VKATRNHQVQHHPDAVIKLDGDPFPNPSQRPNGVAFDGFNRRLHRPQQEGIGQAYAFERLADDARLQCAKISGDIG
jgi:hypothetical protein